MGTMAEPGLGELLERSDELAVMREGAGAVAGGEGRAVVVEGPAGIGKSALVAAACVHARAAGLTPLAARGIELERAFGFGVVRQLLEPAVQDGDFEGAARHAAALLDVPLAERPSLPFGPEGAFVALHGLFHLTADLARRRPLALLVDDAHWADGASLRFLAYLGNRLSRVPVLLVVGARPPGEPGGAAVADMLAEGGARALLRPQGLSEGASAELVRTAVPGALTALCRSCHLLTGGNPFFLRELAGALREAGRERAGDVLDAAPDGVVASVRARLTRFSLPAQRLAGALAIVGDGGLLRHAAALAELEDQDAAEAADALRAGRILMDSRELRFVHPIIRSAVHEQLAWPRARRATSVRRHIWPRRTRHRSGWPRICWRPSRAARIGHATGSARPRTRRCRAARPTPRSPTCGARWRSRLPSARPAGRVAGARAGGVAHAGPRAGDRAPAAGRGDDAGHRCAAVRGAHARGDGRHERPVAVGRDRRARARRQPRREPCAGAAHRGSHGEHGALCLELSSRDLRSRRPAARARVEPPASSTARWSSRSPRPS